MSKNLQCCCNFLTLNYKPKCLSTREFSDIVIFELKLYPTWLIGICSMNLTRTPNIDEDTNTINVWNIQHEDNTHIDLRK